MAERSKYQDKIIKNYYRNRDAIALQRAQELVTELYLATGKKRQKHWESLRRHLPLLGVKESTIENLIQKDDPKLVAEILAKLA